MSRQNVFFKLYSILAPLAAVILAACNPTTAQQPAPARPVLVTSVHYEAQVSDRSFVGTIRPRIESDMGFRVPGKVSKRLVEVGALSRPASRWRRSTRSISSCRPSRPRRNSAPRPACWRRPAPPKRAPRNCGRRAGPPMRRWIRPKAAADEARARLNRAERSVELTKNSLSYATLVADAPGVVTATLIEPGQVVTAGQTAIRVARLAEKEVVVAIPETLLARAKSGEAQVSIWSEPDKQYVAKLRELAPSADPATRTYLAKFSLPEAGDEVQLGMTATLILSDPASERVARLPLSALFNQGDGPSLYVVDGKTGAVTLKPVTVKSYESNDVLISGGVDEGAKVVALGVQKLDPAQKVRVVSSLSF